MREVWGRPRKVKQRHSRRAVTAPEAQGQEAQLQEATSSEGHGGSFSTFAVVVGGPVILAGAVASFQDKWMLLVWPGAAALLAFVVWQTQRRKPARQQPAELQPVRRQPARRSRPLWFQSRKRSPKGASEPAPRLSDFEEVTGVVESVSSPSKSIGSASTCAAWSARIYSKAAAKNAPMVCHGATNGLVVVTDDGHRYQVPAGRPRVMGDGVRLPSTDRQMRALVGNLAERKTLDRHPPVPHDYLIETRVHVGDRVRLRGVFELQESTEGSAEVGYRQAARRGWIAQGEVELQAV